MSMGGNDQSSNSFEDDWGEGESGGILSEINITPLTDIFLVLLIIFMVTSSVMGQLGVDVDLPQANAVGSQTDPEGVVLTLLPGGEMKLNDQRIAPGDWATLQAGLKQAFALSSSRLVILEGDKKAGLGSAIEVMDRARQAGAERFAIAAISGK